MASGGGARAMVAGLGWILVAACGARSPEDPAPVAVVVAGPALAASSLALVKGAGDSEPDEPLLSLRLLESPAAERPLPRAPVVGTPLPPDRVEALVARAGGAPVAAGDAPDFSFPVSTLPPPITGDTLRSVFPADASADGGPPDDVPAGPLTVVRRSPEGEVPLAPRLAVTFDAPMVPVGSLSDLAALDVPVRLAPEPPGSWRWLGTRTLVFEPDPRLPMATTFTATVPAGTSSRTGAVLEAPVSWSFATPPPTLTGHHPRGSTIALDTVHVLAFDQAVDPAAVLASVQLTTSGAGGDGQRHALRLATEEELLADPAAAAFVKPLRADRHVVFRAVEPLPVDSGVTITVGPGTPSAEGPRVTTEPQQVTDRTYGPLVAVEVRCGWEETCRPGAPFTVRFSNPLDAASVDADSVVLDPSVEDFKTEVHGNLLVVSGRTAANTAYLLRLSSSLRDTFGQRLGEDLSLPVSVGERAPDFEIPGGVVMVLDPYLPPLLEARSANVPSMDVLVWRVGPDDWARFGDAVNTYGRTGDLPTYPDLVALETVPLPEDGSVTSTLVGLDVAFGAGPGHAVVAVSAQLEDRTVRRMQWLQRTDLAVDATVHGAQVLASVTSLRDGSPVAGAEVRFLPGDQRATTDADGLATLSLPSPQTAAVLLARAGDDTVLLPDQGPSAWFVGSSRWRSPLGIGRRVTWCVLDDRGTYRPGEQARLKGWLRLVDDARGGDVGLVPGGEGQRIAWTLLGRRGSEQAKGEAVVDAFGGFDLALDLPETIDLGTALVRLEYDDGELASTWVERLEVREFRRPEFEVTLEADDGAPLLGDRVVLTAGARYLAGGGLPGSPVSWRLSATPAFFAPPGWPGWTFGEALPWWRAWQPFGTTQSWTAEGTTDLLGDARLGVELLALATPRPVSLSVEAAVTDENRQQWAAQTSLLVHPSELYAGLRAASTFVARGEPFVVEVVATDRDGVAQPGTRVALRAARITGAWKDGAWIEAERDVLEQTVTSADAPVTVRLEPGASGSWRVTARLVDDAGRANLTRLGFWVSGESAEAGRPVAGDEVELVPDREAYVPGDVAEILVRSPFDDAWGLLTVRRSGVVVREPFQVDGRDHTLAVPLAEEHLPGVFVHVELSGVAPRAGPDGVVPAGAPPRPAYATGELQLPVSPAPRRLAVEVEPETRELLPGDAAAVDVHVTDASGKPVAGGSVAVLVVDEAVLALLPWEAPDLLQAFHPARPSGALDHLLRPFVRLLEVTPADLDRLGTRPGDLPWLHVPMLGAAGESGGLGELEQAVFASAAAEDGASDGRVKRLAAVPGPPAVDEASPIDVRSSFAALALFAPAETTDADGRLRVELALPDSLTRYRVTALAVDAGGQRFGNGSSSITARRPLMVRPSPPRFLDHGDVFELPLVVQNATAEQREVDVVVSTAGPLVLGRSADDTATSAGVRVSVPASDRVEVRFAARASGAGDAQLLAVAADVAPGVHADAARVELPVYTPATTEAFATYGEIDDAVAVVQPVRAPGDALAGFGALELTTSSTQLAALTDAVLSLVTYPFDCAEQRASRVLAVSALRPVLAAFAVPGLPAPDALDRTIDDDLDVLAGLQNRDGGFGFWSRREESQPFVSVHVAHAFVAAGAAGFETPSDVVAKALAFAADLDGFFARHSDRWSERSRLVIRAYALDVLRRAGRTGAPQIVEARQLLAGVEADALPLEAAGWLLPLLASSPLGAEDAERLRTLLSNRAIETAGTAHFVTDWTDADAVLLHGKRRVDGVVLDALLTVEPSNDLLPKLVRGLLASRVRGHWGTTQDDVFVLLALRRWFDAFESEEPDFVAHSWLGDRLAASQPFVGRSVDRRLVEVPMATLQQLAGDAGGSDLDVVLAKQGPGLLVWRLGLRYAPDDLELDPLEAGFTVSRRYEALGDEADVRRVDDGTWHVRAGATVAVRLTVVAPSNRHHVALVDRLPAGFEPVDASLAVSASAPPTAGGLARVLPPWGGGFGHAVLRDVGAEAFATRLGAGVHEHVYVVRAVTPGSFVVPPARAEEMYAPETFGRTGTDRVVVEPP